MRVIKNSTNPAGFLFVSYVISKLGQVFKKRKIIKVKFFTMKTEKLINRATFTWIKILFLDIN